jgi:hypothetical protein
MAEQAPKTAYVPKPKVKKAATKAKPKAKK